MLQRKLQHHCQHLMPKDKTTPCLYRLIYVAGTVTCSFRSPTLSSATTSSPPGPRDSSYIYSSQYSRHLKGPRKGKRHARAIVSKPTLRYITPSMSLGAVDDLVIDETWSINQFLCVLGGKLLDQIEVLIENGNSCWDLAGWRGKFIGCSDTMAV
jgi:hypothetical protein